MAKCANCNYSTPKDIKDCPRCGQALESDGKKGKAKE